MTRLGAWVIVSLRTYLLAGRGYEMHRIDWQFALGMAALVIMSAAFSVYCFLGMAGAL